MSRGKLIKSYKVALGGDPIGPKTGQGDHKTPEGIYVLDFRNPHSQFYKAIHISYPSPRERLSGRQKGSRSVILSEGSTPNTPLCSAVVEGALPAYVP